MMDSQHVQSAAPAERADEDQPGQSKKSTSSTGNHEKAIKRFGAFFTIAEVCALLQVKERWVRQLMANGDLPPVKFGRKVVRIPERAVRDFIKRSTVQMPVEHNTEDSHG